MRSGFLERFGQSLLALGLPGLLILSFLDSAAVPMLGGPDALILVLAWQRPEQSAWIVLAAATGSTLGCLVLYRIGSAGGRLTLKKFNEEKVARAQRKLDQNAIAAVMTAVMAPPPFPTKLIILAAGVFQVNLTRFASAVAAGRLVRYSIVAYLGARFGGQAADVLRSHYPLVSAAIIAVLLAIFLLRRLGRRDKGSGAHR